MQSKEHGLSAEHRLAGDLHTLNFEPVLKQYKPDITRYASNYPKFWQADFCQVGTVALFDAFQKFITLPPERDFRAYALTAIENRMRDFYRKTFSRTPKLRDMIMINEDGEEEEYIYNVTGDIDFFTTTTFDIDYQIIFESENLKAHGFTDSEIRVFNLCINQDLTVTEIAAECKISVGRASQIMASIRKKTSDLIKNSF